MRVGSILALCGLCAAPQLVNARRRPPSLESLALAAAGITRDDVGDSAVDGDDSDRLLTSSHSSLSLSSLSSSNLPPSDSPASSSDDSLPSWVIPASSRRLPTALPPCPNDHLVSSLPGLDSHAFPTKHWAGHVPVQAADWGNDDNMIFYWLFEPANPATGAPLSSAALQDAPLLIWLNGGPGCSSMDGLFLENGPFKFSASSSQSTPKIEVNVHSWHRAPAYVLYVDQPLGTGLSYTKTGKYCRSDLEVDTDFYYFLQNLFVVHSADDATGAALSSRSVYFSGESHAGHYIPSMVDFILKANKAPRSPYQQVKVKGCAIGNGWMDPYHQYASATHAYGAGLLGLPEKRHYDQVEAACQAKIKGGNLNPSVCFTLLDEVVAKSRTPDGKKVSMYDNREWLKAQSEYPPGKDKVEAYLGGPDKSKRVSVLTAIHAQRVEPTGQRFKECADPPWNALAGQDGLGVVDEVVRVLNDEAGVRMLFFNGMNDIICNHVGNEAFLDALPWAQIESYKASNRYVWNAKGETTPSRGPEGFVKGFGPLIFLKIAESGHMVPLDQPSLALAMIREFLEGGDFKSTSTAQSYVTSSTSVSCPVSEDPDPPPPPAALVASEKDCDESYCSAYLTFDTVSGVSFYTLSATPPIPHSLMPQAQLTQTKSPLVISGLAPGASYVFTLRASLSTGLSSEPSEPSNPTSFGCGADCRAPGGICAPWDDGSEKPKVRCVCLPFWSGDSCTVWEGDGGGGGGRGVRKCGEGQVVPDDDPQTDDGDGDDVKPEPEPEAEDERALALAKGVGALVAILVLFSGIFWVWKRRGDGGGWAFQLGAKGAYKSPTKYRTLATIEEDEREHEEEQDDEGNDDYDEEGQKSSGDKKKANHVAGMGIELGTLGRSDTM